MLKCYLLTPASKKDINLKKLKSITSPDYHLCFDGKSPDSAEDALGRVYVAEKEGKLAAVALVSMLNKPKLAEVHEIVILPDFSENEIKEQLIDYLENSLKKERCLVLCQFFEKEAGTKFHHDALFEKRKWEIPRLHMIRYHFDCYLFSPPWFLKEYTLAEDITIFPWKELKSSERKIIQNQQNRSYFPYIISPLYDEDKIQHINSLGMRKKDRVIGWMVTHTFPEKPDTVRYSSFYMAEDERNKGYAPYLLQQSIKLQQLSELQWSYFLLNIEFSDKSWFRFIDKRLKSQSYSIVEVWRRCKTLHTPFLRVSSS